MSSLVLTWASETTQQTQRDSRGAGPRAPPARGAGPGIPSVLDKAGHGSPDSQTGNSPTSTLQKAGQSVCRVHITIRSAKGIRVYPPATQKLST